MKKSLTPAEIEKRFAEINARRSEALTSEETASLAAAEAMDDGTTIDFEALPRQFSN